jgi:hypothetical protein
LEEVRQAQQQAENGEGWAREMRRRDMQATWLRLKDALQLTAAKPRASHWSHEDLMPRFSELMAELGMPAQATARIKQRVQLSAYPGSPGHLTMRIKCWSMEEKGQLDAAKRAKGEGAPKLWHDLTPAQSRFFSAHIYQQFVAALQQGRVGRGRGPSVHVDFRNMVLWVGGQQLNAPDHEQARALMLPPGATWATDEAPTR